MAFLFQLTNDELPTLAAGQTSFFSDTGVQPWQIESFIFLAVDLEAGNWSRTRLARITRQVNRLFPMPVIMLYRHHGHDQEPLLSLAVIRNAGTRGAPTWVLYSESRFAKVDGEAGP